LGIMFRLILFLLLLIVLRGPAEAQSDERSDYFKEGTLAENESPATVDSDTSNLKIENKLGYKGRIPAETPADFEKNNDLSEYIIYGTDTEKYMASFGIAELLWPRHQGSGRAGRNDLLMIGVKKPYYKISQNPYIRGNLDFRLRGSLFGLENKGLITIAYHLRTANGLRELSSSVSFERFSFSINIPFGKSR